MHRLIVLPALFLLFFSGCLNYEQDTRLREDGSGSMDIHYWVSENVISWFSGDGMLTFNRDSVYAQYEAEGITVHSVRVENRDSDSTRHVHVSLAFDDITALPACAGFREMKFSWLREGDVYRFIQELPVSSGSEQAMLDRFTFTYRYDFPGDLRSANADSLDGSHAAWVFQLSDLHEGRKLEAVIVAGSGTNVWWVLAVLAVVLIAAIIFYRKRKKYTLKV
ncbi:MAG: LPXTG cell wall anchor domain-containing protein [Bacteroidetes bacterium]|nr:LPXTG cell wall anchor domain-containing protein [Bacteroidota bacterium]